MGNGTKRGRSGACEVSDWAHTWVGKGASGQAGQRASRAARWRGDVQVLLEELDAGRQVARVELVRDAPAERAELAALVHDRVHEADVEEQLPPLLRVNALQAILVD